MREILFRGISERTNKLVFGSYFNADTGHTIIENGGSEVGDFHFINIKTLGKFTGYEMFKEKVFYGDLVSNNFGTDKEVIREIVEYEGCKMMKRVKGKSRLPKYISLHEHHKLNYRVIGNVHQ